MALGDAQRLVNVTRQVVGQETRSASKVEFVLGVVAVTYGNYADIYLDGNDTYASENFRVPADVYVNEGDTVLCAIDYGSNLGKWIMEVLPLGTYSQLAINPNTGEIFTSDGESVPEPGSIGGGGASNLDGGHADTNYGGTTAIDGGSA